MVTITPPITTSKITTVTAPPAALLLLAGLGLMLLGTALGLLRVGDGDGFAEPVGMLPGVLAWCFLLRGGRGDGGCAGGGWVLAAVGDGAGRDGLEE